MCWARRRPGLRAGTNVKPVEQEWFGPVQAVVGIAFSKILTNSSRSPLKPTRYSNHIGVAAKPLLKSNRSSNHIGAKAKSLLQSNRYSNHIGANAKPLLKSNRYSAHIGAKTNPLLKSNRYSNQFVVEKFFRYRLNLICTNMVHESRFIISRHRLI